MSIALMTTAPCRAAESGPDARAVARNVAHELDVQERLPSDDARGVERYDGGPAPAAPQPAGAVNGQFGNVLVWVAVAFAAAFVIMSLADAVFGRQGASRGRGAGSPSEDAAADGIAGARASLTSADQFAADGRYTEAMHQLLHDTLAALRRRLSIEIPDALTSREILRAVDVRPAERDALRDMISRVEQTWFAQRLAAAADYDAVRACFAVFVAGTPSR
jgi:hypothetical protein